MERKFMIPAAAVIAAAALLLFAFFNGFQVSGKTGFGKFVLAQYDAAPRTNDSLINTTELLRLLKLSNSNTYNMLIRNPEEDFASLEQFLGMSGKEGIDVWVTILPPSELPLELRSDMKYVDYIGWARRLGELSLRHRNLVAWSIDNVLIDREFFTQGYLEEITGAGKKVNPDLKFVPVVYYPNVISPYFDERSDFFDGVQFYYTNFPPGQSDESKVLLPQLETLKAKFPGHVVLGIYATPWSSDYPTSPEYVEQLINLAKQHTDGVMIYILQREGKKQEVVKKLFSEQ